MLCRGFVTVTLGVVFADGDRALFKPPSVRPQSNFANVALTPKVVSNALFVEIPVGQPFGVVSREPAVGEFGGGHHTYFTANKFKKLPLALLACGAVAFGLLRRPAPAAGFALNCVLESRKPVVVLGLGAQMQTSDFEAGLSGGPELRLCCRSGRRRREITMRADLTSARLAGDEPSPFRRTRPWYVGLLSRVVIG